MRIKVGMVFSREVNRMVRVVLDLDRPYETIPLADRAPGLYHEISTKSM